MSVDNHGMPTIAGLCALCGALVAWNVGDIVAGADARSAELGEEG